MELKAGKQTFRLREKVRGIELNYIKLEILSSYGSQDRVYIN